MSCLSNKTKEQVQDEKKNADINRELKVDAARPDGEIRSNKILLLVL
jgi:hypothetical protein